MESKLPWEALWTADLHKKSRGGPFQGQEVGGKNKSDDVDGGGQMWQIKAPAPHMNAFPIHTFIRELLLLIFPHMNWACGETQGAGGNFPTLPKHRYKPSLPPSSRPNSQPGRNAQSEREGREPRPRPGGTAPRLPPAVLTTHLRQPRTQPGVLDTARPLALTSKPHPDSHTVITGSSRVRGFPSGLSCCLPPPPPFP